MLSTFHEFGDNPAPVTLTVSRGALEAATSCLEACADDANDLPRYRDWYRRAVEEFREADGADPVSLGNAALARVRLALGDGCNPDGTHRLVNARKMLDLLDPHGVWEANG